MKYEYAEPAPKIVVLPNRNAEHRAGGLFTRRAVAVPVLCNGVEARLCFAGGTQDMTMEPGYPEEGPTVYAWVEDLDGIELFNANTWAAKLTGVQYLLSVCTPAVQWLKAEYNAEDLAMMKHYACMWPQESASDERRMRRAYWLDSKKVNRLRLPRAFAYATMPRYVITEKPRYLPKRKQARMERLCLREATRRDLRASAFWRTRWEHIVDPASLPDWGDRLQAHINRQRVEFYLQSNCE